MSDGCGIALTLLFVLCAIVCSIIGAHGTGQQHGREQIQLEAIEHGYAEYDSKSGEWQWKKIEAELVP